MLVNPLFFINFYHISGDSFGLPDKKRPASLPLERRRVKLIRG